MMHKLHVMSNVTSARMTMQEQCQIGVLGPETGDRRPEAPADCKGKLPLLLF